MSYILDALRRADADRERDRGAVPGLHARPLAAAVDAPRGATPPAAWLALGGALLAVMAVLAWWALRGPTPAALPVAQVPAPVVGAAPTAAVQQAQGPVPTPLPTPVPTFSPQVPVPQPTQRSQLPQVATPPAPNAQTQSGLRVSPGQSSTAATPVQRQPLPAAERPAASRPQPAEITGQRPVQLTELPPELRREMPAMTVGGSIYSDSPASRFVMVNGQIVREGEPAAPGVVLERIGPKSAVLRWRDLRIEVPL